MVGVRRDLKNHLIPPQETLSSGPGCSNMALNISRDSILNTEYSFSFLYGLDSADAWVKHKPWWTGKWKKKGNKKKKSIKKGEVCECDDFYDFSAPHTSFPTCLMSNQNLRELEKETTDLGWVGAANPTISCLWCDKPRLWDLQEHQHCLPPHTPSPPTRTWELGQALFSQIRWLSVTEF